MSKKFSFIFSILVFAILFSFIGCTDLLAPKTQTDINLNIDLSKIIKSSRNEGGSQGASSLGDNPTIKVAIYDAKDYDKATNSTENLTLITQAQASVGGDGIARVKLNDIPVGIDAIVFAELSFTNENSTQVVYAGNSGVFKVKASDNKVSLVLKKVANSETSPDNTNTSYENYTLYKKTENGEDISNDNEASISTSSTEETIVTVKNTYNSDSVWTYFVKPNNNTRFTENGNYKVSVELKADNTTVVGIAAARADYFFTVNNDWTPCEFNTGYLIGNEKHQFTIGLGLSSEIQIRNLKIEKLSEIDTSEPSLVFDISRHAIETYLNSANKKIIEVSKKSTERSYNITINAPLSHSATVQDVKLHLRSYATENTGANSVSFIVDNPGANTFYTSVMADTANEKSIAWNNGTQQITSGALGSYKIDFPNYVQNDELNVGVITSSNEAITEPINLKISEFAVTVPNASVSPFANKIFAIQVGENWTQRKSVEVTIPAKNKKEFDVGMFNGWDSSNNMPSSFDDVTRFFYTGDTNIKDDLIYSVNNDNPNDPIFTITNESVEDKIVKISLNENYEVVIEEVTGATITSWDNLKSQIEGLNNSNTTFVITGELTATEEITISAPVKITANNDVKITRGNFTGNFFNVSSGVSLEIAGSENSTITLDGGNSDTISADSPLITVNGKLTLSNCTLQNNTNSALPNAFGGAVYVDGGTLNFSSGTIQNCIAGDAGAVYLTNGGSFEMSGGTIQNCEASLSGGAVWMDNGSSFIMDGGEISNCKTTGNEGGALYITGTGCSALMKGTAKITGCQSTNKAAGGVNLGGGTFTMTDDSCISDCTANTDGNGIYINGGTFNISGDAYVNSSNDVYFSDNTSNIINISGILTKGEVAKISLSEYTVGKQILSAGDEVDLAEQVGKFTLSNANYVIGTDGKIASAINYAQGLTYDSITNTLYISNEEGLITFRDIVNGTLTESVTIKATSPNNTDITFDYTGYDNSARTLNAKLTTDITLSGEWTPIGHSSIYSYAGTFDGDGHTISNLNINETTSSDSTGFIGYSGYNGTGGIIQNLVISGTMNVNSAAAGGFVGTSAVGCTITNCVNQINITNTSEAEFTGTAGFVGLLEYDYKVSISNSINWGNITGTKNVAGFVGSYSEYSYPQFVYTIDKSINIGKITSTSSNSIAGFSTIYNAKTTTLSNLMNMGSFASQTIAGICYSISDMTISNCINTGKSDIENSSYYAIIPIEKTTSNCYFDISINPDYPYGGTGKTTAELCAFAESDLSNDWTFEADRYPLPDIGSSIPGGQEGDIWKAVIAAATPEDIGGGTPNYTVYTDYATLKNAVVAISSGDSGVFYVQGYIESTSTTITVKGDVTIIATSEGATISRKSTFTGDAIFTVNNGASLKLGGDTSGSLIIDGGSEKGIEVSYPLINSSGSLEIGEHCILQNNNNVTSTKKGGAIYEYCTSGDAPTLKISGGKIQNCNATAGGAIYIEGGTSCEINFDFSGGEISNNYATGNGGAVYLKNTSGTLSGTIIKNNYAKLTSPGFSAGGGGIYVTKSTLNMTAGSIENNTTNSYGGGVFVNTSGIFNITGGDIKENATNSETTDSMNIYAYGTVTINETTVPTACNQNIINGVLTDEISSYEFTDFVE